eukprot:TRINITY_DN24459_c0_g1_i1.p1 TRINITY_DN24459_c0_g1~~TRINITY_DN24459_c0_g1_i1.p1  ORF type:complete len:166 (-),score=39.53 TRINITY_DN24459_c0_g1_i1:14-511(-)
MRTFAALLFLTMPLTQAADKHPWASFKPGSYAKMKSTMQAGPTKMVTEMTQTLVSLDANNAVVEIETKAMGQANKTRTNIPLKAAANGQAAQAKPISTTNETITVAGKALACKCVEVETEANGMKSTSKACTSEAVPGGAVRVVTKTTGAMKSETVSELVEFAAK